MICRICLDPCDREGLCSDCAAIKRVLKAYYSSLGGVDLAHDAPARKRVLAGAKGIVDAHTKHRAARSALSVN